MTERNPITGPRDRFANLEGVIGETFTGEIILCESDGVTPINLTGYTVTFYVWNGDKLEIESVCEQVDTEGVIKLSIPHTKTLSLMPVAHHYELWADNGEGGVKLILWGWLWFKGGCIS